MQDTNFPRYQFTNLPTAASSSFVLDELTGPSSSSTPHTKIPSALPKVRRIQTFSRNDPFCGPLYIYIYVYCVYTYVYIYIYMFMCIWLILNYSFGAYATKRTPESLSGKTSYVFPIKTPKRISLYVNYEVTQPVPSPAHGRVCQEDCLPPIVFRLPLERVRKVNSTFDASQSCTLQTFREAHKQTDFSRSDRPKAIDFA